VDVERPNGLTDELSEFWSKRGGGSSDAPTNGSTKRPEPGPSATRRGSD
jgi:hypothetical protein